jgi:hypothetical protein
MDANFFNAASVPLIPRSCGLGCTHRAMRDKQRSIGRAEGGLQGGLANL